MTTTPADLVDVRMPSLGADMTEGEIVEWCVRPDDRVERGDIVAVVHTDKSDIEIEVFEAGTISELVVEPGHIVPVGATIARLRPAGARAVEPPPERPTTDTAASAPGPTAVPHRVVSPVLRHLADREHLDLGTVTGTGAGGRITRDDLERSSTTPGGHGVAPAPRTLVTPRARRLAAAGGLALDQLRGLADTGRAVTGDQVDALLTQTRVSKSDDGSTAMRTRISSLMSQSWRDIPHYHLQHRLDLTTSLAGMRAANEHRPLASRLLPAAVLLAAAARAARDVPACNGWWRDGRLVAAERVDLGVIVSLRSGGIVAPTIAGADQLDLDAVMARLRELVERARRSRLRSSDVGEASISVTNLGDTGAETVHGVIHPPQVALVGFGAIHDEVWAVDGAVVVRPTVHASLAGDHRAMDGAVGSAYLRALQRHLDTMFDQHEPEEAT